MQTVSKNDANLISYNGQIIGNLKIIDQSEIFHKRFKVQCLLCNTIFEIGIKTLLDGYVSSCCQTILNPNRKNLSNLNFANNQLLTLRPCGKYKKKILYLVECQCIFKTKFIVTNEDLEYNKTKSCRHDEYMNGMFINNNLPIWKIYDGIYQRCYNENSPNYSNYGARGIKLDHSWEPPNGLRNFISYINLNLGWAISKEFSIDRIDNDLGYIPDNLRWATSSEQNRNRSITKLSELDIPHIKLIYSTNKYTSQQIANMYNVSRSLINNIINNKLWK